MKLTKLDLNRLRNSKRARERPPKATIAMWRLKPLWLAIIAITVLGYWTSPSRPLAYFVAGLGAGGLFCACVFAFILQRFWPLTREILNWDRIDELIKEHDGEGS
jgi:hypothetical protein